MELFSYDIICDTHEQERAEQYSMEILEQQLHLSDQDIAINSKYEGIIFHEFHDPMDSWMELYFSKVYDVLGFCVLPISSCKYQLPTDSLLHLSYLLWVFSNSDMYRSIIVSQIVSWLYWKYDYT